MFEQTDILVEDFFVQADEFIDKMNETSLDKNGLGIRVKNPGFIRVANPGIVRIYL
jgi:hypothetical protein